jgi:uncharacterized SAM-binding protein YcdF (DUF218 family)
VDKLSPELVFSILVSNNRLKKSDGIILLEGDYHNRVAQAAELFKNGWAPTIVVSGDTDKPEVSSIHSRHLIESLLKENIPAKNIIPEFKSQNTWEQGVEIMKIVKENKWKRIILVASNFHQFRAFLTFLKAMKEFGMQIEIYNSPARSLDWFKLKPGEPYGPRINLLEGEFKRISTYVNNVASFEEGIEYLKWLENQA